MNSPVRSSSIRSVSRVLLAGVALVALLGAVGCVSSAGGPNSPISRVTIEPQGPGQVFVTAEVAAFDALAWCERASGRGGSADGVARGGTVYPVEGGFSYAEPSRASGASERLHYRLRPADVLHFRHYPSSLGTGTATTARALSTRDRRLVDRRDPLRRPIYFMTPDRRVRVYPGGEGERGRRTLALLPETAPTEVPTKMAAEMSGELTASMPAQTSR